MTELTVKWRAHVEQNATTGLWRWWAEGRDSDGETYAISGKALHGEFSWRTKQSAIEGAERAIAQNTMSIKAQSLANGTNREEWTVEL